MAENIEKHPDAYQHERTECLSVSPRCIGYALQRLGISCKKTLHHPKAEDALRTTFQKTINAYQAEEKNIVYIDESGFSKDVPRTHGYSPKNARCYGQCDWQTKGVLM